MYYINIFSGLNKTLSDAFMNEEQPSAKYPKNAIIV
jgi:hypothetical protein